MRTVRMLDGNGNYLGEHECQTCQLTGEYLYPTYYTEELKPEVGDFKKAKYNFETREWMEVDCFINKKLYHKQNKTTMVIDDESKSPADYPDYTDVEIPDIQYAYYYDFSEAENAWVFNLSKYKLYACKKITTLCVNENYTMFPQYKRDNIYSGSPVSDSYPAYLKGEEGKASIARLNAIYQSIAVNAQADINAATVASREAVDEIITAIVFPSEAEILAQIQS